MAANFTAAAAAAPSSSLCRLYAGAHSHRFQCSGSGGGGNPQGRGTPRLLKAAVSGVTKLLRLLPRPPRKQRGNSPCDTSEGSGGVAEAPLVLRGVEDVLSILRSDYVQAYFLTGNFTSEIYSEDCLFEDPTIKFNGKGRYSQNLELLVPFFDRPSLVLEKIEKGVDHEEREFILATWRLRTYLRLPWMPIISIGGTTTYGLDDKFKIVRHVERWNVSALEAVGQIFTPSGNRDG